MATTTSAAATSSFLGTRLSDAKQSKPGRIQASAVRIQARFGFGKKKAPPKRSVSKDTDRPLWYPGAKAPEYLDGSLVGDYGFDPFGLGKPAEYLQFDLDSLDQNLAKNLAGDVIGTRFETSDVKSTPFQPYSEVFGLQRFRECELIHGRWAMLATLGALTVEWLTGVTWQDAGKDMVLLHHEVEVEFPDGQPAKKHKATLLEFGRTENGKTTTAMASTVGITAAIGALLLLADKIKTRGVLRPIEPEVYVPALEILQAYGIKLLEKMD